MRPRFALRGEFGGDGQPFSHYCPRRTALRLPLARCSRYRGLFASVIGDRLTDGVVLRLSAKSLERVKLLADSVSRGDVGATSEAARNVLADLRAHGLPFAPDALGGKGPRIDVSSTDFARVLWSLAGNLSGQPMAVDLSEALRVSERHALRRASSFLRRFCLSASSWREFMNALRLEMGAFFMSAPGARTEDVSRFLGFASPTGFCHAFQDAGLPSPQRIHHELRSV